MYIGFFMGLYYRTMIREIRAEFKNQDKDLETFIKDNEERFRVAYRLGDLLFYLNIMKVFAEENISSEYYKQKDEAAQKANMDFL
jgi:hypothetical protein